MSGSTTWRLIDTGPLGGRRNMAVDEALLAAFDPATSPPVLRLYGWEPPALSLGRFQEAEILDREQCAAAGVAVVRRITGGGTIYHADEVTYSVVCSPRHLPAAASVKESFRILTRFLLGFYAGLGLSPRYAADEPAGERLGERTAYCFAGRESCDIVIRGKKIGGNAQRRLRDVIFQHGSIPMESRAVAGAAFLRDPGAIAGRVTSLAEEGVRRKREELVPLLALSFAESLGVTLGEDGLTEEELMRAASLEREKYGNDDWNFGEGKKR